MTGFLAQWAILSVRINASTYMICKRFFGSRCRFSNQALSELCSTIGGLNVINIDAYCNQQQISNQTQHVSENNGTSNSQGSTNNNQGNPQNPSSNSIVDKILGLLFGFLKF